MMAIDVTCHPATSYSLKISRKGNLFLFRMNQAGVMKAPLLVSTGKQIILNAFIDLMSTICTIYMLASFSSKCKRIWTCFEHCIILSVA